MKQKALQLQFALRNKYDSILHLDLQSPIGAYAHTCRVLMFLCFISMFYLTIIYLTKLPTKTQMKPITSAKLFSSLPSQCSESKKLSNNSYFTL